MPVQKWYDDDRIIYQPTAKAIGLLQKGTGVISNGNVVQRAAGANMSVDFDATTVIIDGTQFSYVAGNKLVDAAPTVANQTRLDLIYVDSAGVQYAAGVAAVPVTGVTYPDPANLGDTQVALALIEVGNGVTSIVDARIVDTRMIGNPAALVVGTNPASSGSFRMPNAANVVARNFANNGDINVVQVNTSDNLVLRLGSGQTVVGDAFLSVGAAPALSGGIRIPNNSAVVGRNAANTADRRMLIVDTADVLSIGGSDSPSRVQLLRQRADLANSVALALLTNDELWFSTDGLTTGAVRFLGGANPSILIGATPAASGIIRLPNNQIVAARNQANTADLILIQSNTLDEVVLAAANVRMGTVSTYISMGSPAAATGFIRLPAGQKITWRNAANTGDQGFIWGTTSDFVEIGDSIGTAMRFNAVLNTSFASFAVGVTPATSGIIRLPATTDINARNIADTFNYRLIGSANNRVMLGDGNVDQIEVAATGTASVRIGLNPSSTGIIRIPNAQGIVGRNFANTADRTLIDFSAGDLIRVSPDGSATQVAASGASLGFYGTTPAAKPTVTGSRGGNAALADLLTDLATLGLITDSSTA